MEMGTNSSGAWIREVNSTMGPSAPPIVATAAACPGSRPKPMPTARVTKVPSSANRAMVMLVQGLASRKLISLWAPIPMNTRQAMSPLENMKL